MADGAERQIGPGSVRSHCLRPSQAPPGALLGLAVLLLPGWVTAQTWRSIPVSELLRSSADNRICLSCHGWKGVEGARLYVSRSQFEHSVHADRLCTDCHQDVKVVPHSGPMGSVSCDRCHFAGGPAGYMESVHKQALDRGDPRAPNCQSCHGSHGILPVRAQDSPVSRREIPGTCGRCHREEHERYLEGIHGQALLKGNDDTPVCTDCHGEHTIRNPKNPKSLVYATRIANTCGRCHGRAALERRYRIPPGRLSSYGKSYHGVASRYGLVTVANCASCHRAHEILPSSDPRSSVSKRNLPRTCGKRGCHPDAGERFALGSVHERSHRYVGTFFILLTVATMAALIGHIVLDLFSRWREHRRAATAGRA